MSLRLQAPQPSRQTLLRWGREALRDHNHTGAVLRTHELREVRGHRPGIVRDEDPPLACGDAENFDVLQAAEARRVGSLEVDVEERRSTVATMI